MDRAYKFRPRMKSSHSISWHLQYLHVHLLQPSGSNLKLYGVRQAQDVIGRGENAEVIDRCHTSHQSGNSILGAGGTDSWTAEIPVEVHWVRQAICDGDVKATIPFAVQELFL